MSPGAETVLALVLASLLTLVAAPASEPVILADFDADEVGAFPTGWLVKDSLGRLRERDDPGWRVREESGQRYLEARAEARAATIGRAVDWDVEQRPVLSWRWRVLETPKGANESVKQLSDSAAGLYVFFEGGPFWNPYALKYVWSDSLPVGSVLESPYSSNTKILVLRSGQDDVGSWVEERRDVVADFRDRFEGHEPVVKAIGLLTDSDNTGSVAVAHYSRLGISTE